MGLLKLCVFLAGCTRSPDMREAVGFITVNEVVARCDGEGNCAMRMGVANASATRVLWDGDYFWLTAGHVCQTMASEKDISFDRITTVTALGKTEKKELGKSIHMMNPDLCIMEAEPGPARKIAGTDTLRPEQKLYTEAFPGGAYAPGLYPKYKGEYMGRVNDDMCVTNIPVAPGSSGGGVINRRGEVVGVVSSVLASFNHLSMFVCPGTLRKFVEGSARAHRILHAEELVREAEKMREQSQSESSPQESE